MQNASQTNRVGPTQFPEQREYSLLDITAELDALKREQEFQTTGIARKALIRYSDLRLTLIALKQGKRIDEHHSPGRISVQPVEGRIRMHAAGETFDIPKGRVLVLDRAVRHDVEALEESAFLLTAAVPER